MKIYHLLLLILRLSDVGKVQKREKKRRGKICDTKGKIKKYEWIALVISQIILYLLLYLFNLN